ncbi:unnamed protein product [Anisakis simplex]|uniref:STAS domain-containing protein n=1 Tax=Anisakis simplex TaxID=6269 RepID=A0A0M3JWL0_ANISI|nr:unnamed protein product [Anisakis simplex]
MFKKWDELKYLWRLSKIDLLIWVIAFTSTVFIGVIYGLAISMAFALVSVVVRTYMPSRFDSTVNDNRAVIKTVELDCSQKDTSWHTASDTIYYRFSFALSFATVDKFKDSFQKTYVQWSELRATRVDSVEQLDSIYLVFDFEAMKFIDTSGISSIKEVI